MEWLSDTIYRFAVYEFFWVALTVFIFGAAYRLLRMLLFWKRPVKAEARHRSAGELIVALIRTFLDPIIFSLKHRTPDFIFGLTLLHLIGVIPVLFLLAQHVIVWAYYFPPYWIVADLGLWIPLSMTSGALTVTSPVPPVSEMSAKFVDSIWGPLTIVMNGDVLAILAMIGVGGKIGMKILEKAHGSRNVRIGDIVNYVLLFGILLTGFMAARHAFVEEGLYTSVSTYRLWLGLHVLFAELLLMWLPFSKYWHFIFGYWYGKLHEYWDARIQRGAV
ncbi:hypothetical protein Pyrfu_0080 [Pyrolobus fumarii 1A]|uniref:Nitrate reductase gamma subunit n=1 Tax=Pyrolobus fumarii (strain DSM 11204 / 1A) TaxID=694429 RepID=G0EE36_PYRF1|nr:hypothetical protein [Pyrolobus fumarii]AEM37952.1 hypothetical protein Pyrfu_0080 [Pyrolobus fumarii 1A]